MYEFSGNTRANALSAATTVRQLIGIAAGIESARCSRAPLWREPVTYGAYNLATRGENAKNCECTAVDHGLAIDKDFVLAVAPVFGVNLDLQLSSELRRRTDGVESGDSVGAIANDDSGHLQLLWMAMWRRAPAGRLTDSDPEPRR